MSHVRHPRPDIPPLPADIGQQPWRSEGIMSGMVELLRAGKRYGNSTTAITNNSVIISDISKFVYAVMTTTHLTMYSDKNPDIRKVLSESLLTDIYWLEMRSNYGTTGAFTVQAKLDTYGMHALPRHEVYGWINAFKQALPRIEIKMQQVRETNDNGQIYDNRRVCFCM